MCSASRRTGTPPPPGSARNSSPASATAAASRSRRRPEALAERVLAALTRLSAEVILETAFAEDGLDGAATVAHALVQRVGRRHEGIARLTVALDRPVIGLGASAPLHYAGLPQLVGNECVVPEDTDVANALGAVVGQVRVSAEAGVSQPKEGLFRVSSGDTVRDFSERGRGDRGGRSRCARDRRRRAPGPPAPTRPRSKCSREFRRPPRSRASACSSRRRSVAVATGRPRIAV